MRSRSRGTSCGETPRLWGTVGQRSKTNDFISRSMIGRSFKELRKRSGPEWCGSAWSAEEGEMRTNQGGSDFQTFPRSPTSFRPLMNRFTQSGRHRCMLKWLSREHLENSMFELYVRQKFIQLWKYIGVTPGLPLEVPILDGLLGVDLTWAVLRTQDDRRRGLLGACGYYRTCSTHHTSSFLESSSSNLTPGVP